MEVLQVNKLKRNSKIFKSYFTTKGEITTTKVPLRAIVLSKYLDKKLAFIEDNFKTIAIYAIIDDNNNYCVVNAPIYQILTPSNIENVSIDSVAYKLLYFNANDVFMPTNKLIVTEDFLYELFDLFIIQGNVPWFLNYDDVSNIMLQAKKYAGSNICKDPLSFEILTSITARDISNKKKYYRHILKSKNDKILPTYIGLNNIYYSFDNTGAKLMGSYFGEGVLSAIVDKETKTSETSNILRS